MTVFILTTSFLLKVPTLCSYKGGEVWLLKLFSQAMAEEILARFHSLEKPSFVTFRHQSLALDKLGQHGKWE
jgi:hypothetical protein